MNYSWLPALAIPLLGCNTVDPDSCYPNPAGGSGDSDPMPIGAGVGASAAGDYATDPPKGPLDGDSSCASNPCVECPKSPGVDERALEQEDLKNADGAGGVNCNTPADCVDKCVAESKWCVAAHAVHPNKPPMVGDLYQCLDRFPPAKAGGSYTCLYEYPNGDVCIFAYGSKLGPFHFPAPPPLCVYKSP